MLNEQSATVPTWNGDTKHYDDCEFDVLMYERGSNPGDHCFLVPCLICGLTSRAREHLRIAGDLNRFAVSSGLEIFLDYVNANHGNSSTTGRGSGTHELHSRNPMCELRVHDELDQPT